MFVLFSAQTEPLSSGETVSSLAFSVVKQTITAKHNHAVLWYVCMCRYSECILTLFGCACYSHYIVCNYITFKSSLNTNHDLILICIMTAPVIIILFCLILFYNYFGNICMSFNRTITTWWNQMNLHCRIIIQANQLFQSNSVLMWTHFAS